MPGRLPVGVFFAVCGMLLVGCGVRDAGPSALPPAVGMSACRDAFAALDRQIDRAGVRDVDSVAIPGFPFLRINRLLASFGAEPLAPAARQEWLQALATLDAEGRRVELAALNAPAATVANIDRCRATLLADVAQDSSAFERLHAAARVPDNYSLPARVLGLYPVAAFFARQGVRSLQAREAPRPVLHLTPTAQLYATPPVARTALADATEDFARAPRDTLGRPQPSPATLQTLLAGHAPVWAIDTLSDADRIGQMARDAEGRAVLKPTPSVYVWTSQTRFEQQVLTQLNYLVWFSARPPQGAFDPLAGAFDGLIWRLTLDADGVPLLWDSVHACGCYHLWFPGPRLSRRAVADKTETPWVAFSLEMAGRPGLQIDAGTHYLKGVAAAPERPAETLAMLNYDALRQLPDGRGGVRSLFAANGLLEESVRPERWLLWPLGVPSAGTMRQRGHQATAFIGRRHFDDARGIERYFERKSGN